MLALNRKVKKKVKPNEKPKAGKKESSEATEARLQSQKELNIANTYHVGYNEQMKKWPKHPLDDIIPYLTKHLKKNSIVADMGCGSCRLNASLKTQRVISIDFAPPTSDVLPPRRFTVEEVMKKGGLWISSVKRTGLPGASVNACVFSLSLMGTDWPTFVQEALRVLKPEGLLIIAEVSSRLKEPEKFVRALTATSGIKLERTVRKIFNYESRSCLVPAE